MKGGWIDPESFGVHSRWYLGHTFRYYLARGFLRPTDIVLDAGTGAGYGAYIMSSAAKFVIGLDLDERAIKVANQKHSRDNIRYGVCDLDTVPDLPSVDVIVSFETIEHLEGSPKRFADLMKIAAKRMVIVSAPVVPTVEQNKYHNHDFTEDSLMKLILGDGWALWERVRQGIYLVIAAYKKDLDWEAYES